MSVMDLQLNPHKIRGTTSAWWYEEENGITVVQEYYKDHELVKVLHTVIPWRSIRSALKRLEKR